MPEAERRQPKTETPEAQAMRAQLGRMLQAAVDGLPESYRCVFVLREVEQLNTSETAECLGLSEEAVKTRLHRSRALSAAGSGGPRGPGDCRGIFLHGRALRPECGAGLERIGFGENGKPPEGGRAQGDGHGY